MKFSDIKTPKELLDYMNKNINYGYLGKSGRVYHFNDKDFNEKWEEEYILESSEDVFNNKIGNCFDQVELERDFFTKMNYEFKTFYHQVLLNYDNSYPTHTFLVYKENDKWFWFENAWYEKKGIHEFNSLEDLLEFEYNENLKLLKEYGIKSEEISKISYFEYKKPKSHIDVKEYINFVTNNKKIDIMLSKVDKFPSDVGRTQL